MRIHLQVTKRVLLFGAIAGVVAGWGKLPAQTLSANDIVNRVIEHDGQRLQDMDHYQSQRTYSMTYHGPMGERNAQVTARMQFTAPDQKNFTVVSESGSPIFCQKVLRKLMDAEREGALQANHMRSMLSPENDYLTLVGEETVYGVKAWVIDVQPKSETKFNYKGRVWISKNDYAVVRVAGAPAKSPTWVMSNAKFDYRYARSGEFWLPAHSVTESHLRIGGEITLTVDYGTYEIVPASARSVVASREGETGVGGGLVRAGLPQ